MAFYRSEDGRAWMHVHFGGKAGPPPCRGPRLEHDDPEIAPICQRISVALCDYPAGTTLGGKPLTCDAPMCEHHRTKIGPNVDHCPRHAKAELR